MEYATKLHAGPLARAHESLLRVRTEAAKAGGKAKASKNQQSSSNDEIAFEKDPWKRSAVLSLGDNPVLCVDLAC